MRTYCFRTCISISHSNDYNVANAHVHTLEIAAYVRFNNSISELNVFNSTENLIAESLERYKECYLNDVEGFEENVSNEYFGEVVFFRLFEIFDDSNICMEKLEIGETPLRTYIITRTV